MALVPGGVADLLAELDALGIQLDAPSGGGDCLRYRPRHAVTVDLAARMKAHKPELLAAVRKRALDRRIAEQLAELVAHQTRDGRRGWTNPRDWRELEKLGLL